ncbi:hypothetical protein ATO3_24795 [Marinibacterium profundimaris]|uniref:Exopolysaccharide biosynthesis protein n=1 Tax=Marinibacterium profundimaris TaxID=1679460 RepID=A0A225NBT2_9RHOB|nr:hypothetical protein ATO3_24795 [Marinibacterium profundimaris]
MAKQSQTPPAGSDGGQAEPKALPRLIDRIEDLAGSEAPVSVGAVTDMLGARSHAPMLMFVALLMILPVGMIPGVGGVLGVIAALIGLQMIRGRKGLWLPAFIRHREVPAHSIRQAVRGIRPPAAWLSRHLQTRLPVLAEGQLSLWVIALVLVLGGASMMVLGAIPFAIPLVGLPIACFAVGILTGDGLVVAAGYAILFSAFAVTLVA